MDCSYGAGDGVWKDAGKVGLWYIYEMRFPRAMVSGFGDSLFGLILEED